MKQEKRIYVVVAETVQVLDVSRLLHKTIMQPSGRQFAQGCHVVSKLRVKMATDGVYTNHRRGRLIDIEKFWKPITTIILQARDSAELLHIRGLLNKKKLKSEYFLDENAEAYSPAKQVETAIAVLATKDEVAGILDYLPLWDKHE